MREHLRQHLALARHLGLARCRIEHRGSKHPCLLGELSDGRIFRLAIGGTVHTHGCAIENSLKRLKKKLHAAIL